MSRPDASPLPGPDAEPGRPAAAPTPFSGRRLARGVVYSGLALGLPLAAGLALIPLLLQSLGQVRFGLLTLCWGLLAYLAVLDLGVGRALTKLIAEAHGERAHGRAAPLVFSGILVALTLGVLGGLALAAAAHLLPAPILDLAPALDAEVRRALVLMAPIVPVILVSEVARGVLEGHGRFDLSAAVRLPLGVLNFAAPVAASAIAPDLALAVGAILAVRVAALVAYLVLAARVVGERLGWRQVGARAVRRLLGLGGWMTVSSVLAPVFMVLDRFAVAILLSVEAVAYYTTPFEVITRLTLIADALLAVAFPAFAWWAAREPARLPALYASFVKICLALALPVLLVAIAFAPEFLRLWLGPDFADRSATVLRLLAVGTLANALARVPFGLLQSVGRADLTAKLHLAQTLPYVVLLFWLTATFGIVGTAAAWTLRSVVDMAALFVLAARYGGAPLGGPAGGWLLAGLGVGLAACVLPIGVGARAAIVAMVGTGLALFAWRALLTTVERDGTRDTLSRIARGTLKWQ